MYTYFIHYNYKNWWCGGKGNAILTIDTIISTVENIRDVESVLAGDGKFRTVIITNFILLNRVSDPLTHPVDATNETKK